MRIDNLSGGNPSSVINLPGGSLTIAQSVDGSFAGAIRGAGNMIKMGAGALNLTGVNSYAGSTSVSAGNLAVNGSVASAVTVMSGARLSGTGLVGDVTIAAGGTYAPGNSIGTQNVRGNISFAAGSVLEVEASADGRADRVNAGGIITLSGGTVRVNADTSNFDKVTSYVVLTAAGGINGTFSAATANYAFLDPILSYTSNAAILTLARNDISFASIATSDNERRVADNVQSLGLGNPVYNVVLLQSADAARRSFALLSGEVHATVPSVLLDETRRFRSTILDRAAGREAGISLWSRALRDEARIDGDTNVASSRADHKGFISGVDFGSRHGWRIGLHGAYMQTDMGIMQRNSMAQIKSFSGGAYGGWSTGPVSLVAGAGYTRHRIDTQRNLRVMETARYNANSRQAYGEVSYRVIDSAVTVAPYLTYALMEIETDAVTESGNAAALHVPRQKRIVHQGAAGLRMTGDISISPAITLQPRLSASAQAARGDITGLAAPNFARGSGQAFGVTGARIGRSGINLEGSLDIVLWRHFRLGLGGFMSEASGWTSYGAQASAGLRF